MDLGIPISVLTDTYKISHPFQYPEALKMVAYGEFRCAFDRDPLDSRIVFTGMRYIVERYLCKRWTVEDVAKSAQFFATHNAGFSKFPFPEDLFLKFIKENDGYFPIKVQSLPEGKYFQCRYNLVNT